MLLLAAALALPAHASLCIDLDSDGAGPFCAVSWDCNNGDPAVHPRAPEDGIDDVDNDCDGSVLVHRH